MNICEIEKNLLTNYERFLSNKTNTRFKYLIITYYIK